MLKVRRATNAFGPSASQLSPVHALAPFQHATAIELHQETIESARHGIGQTTMPALQRGCVLVSRW